MKLSNRFTISLEENAITRKKKELALKGISIFDASSSNPSKCNLIPNDSVFTCFFNESIKMYSPDPQGLYSAREALAQYYDSKPENFFLTASTSEAYSWLFKLLGNPGDTFLIPKPGYPLFDYLAEQECVKLAPYYLEYIHPGGWYIDLDALESTIRTHDPKGIIVINPNNPTGSYISNYEYEKLISLCEQYDLCIIADEVFYPFSLNTETKHVSFVHCNDIPVFTLNGFSKLLCLPQVKQGWIHVSNMVSSAARNHLELIADTFLSANIFTMSALPELLRLSESWLTVVKTRIRENYITAHLFFQETTPIRVRTAQGGWSVMLEVPRYETDEQLILDLLTTYHMYLQPGYFFDTKEAGIVVPSLILEPEAFTKCLTILETIFTE